MTHTRTWKRFLDILPEELALARAHADVLAGSADILAARFYEFLLAHPETAQVFRDFDEQRLRELTKKQAEHYRRMLLVPIDRQSESELDRIGRAPHRRGTSPIWMVGAYRLYIEHLDEQIDGLGLQAHDQKILRHVLSKRVLYDMALQLAANEKAQHAEEDERMAVARVLLDTTSRMSSLESPEVLFGHSCDRLVVVSRSLQAVWFSLDRAVNREVTPLHVSGKKSLVPRMIALSEHDPLQKSLQSGQPCVIDPHATDAPLWCRGLQSVAAIGIFPFGMKEGLRGIGVVYADQADYFARIDLSPFGAFAHLGDLLMQIRRQVQTDPLTGLPNRKSFTEHLEQARSRARRRKRLLAVGMLDLDDFKPVNDRYGHDAGDAFLKAIAQRLRNSLRAGDLAARLGGDEFAFILEDVESLNDLEIAMQRIGKEIFAPISLDDGTGIGVRGSVGVTVFPLDDAEGDELLRHADQAMYLVKGEKGRRDRFWGYWRSSAPATAQSCPRFHLEEQAITWFQPVLSLQKNAIVAIEALARMSENGQILTPQQFLPLLDAEERRELSRLMLTQGLQLLERLDAAGIHLDLSFHVDPDFMVGHDCLARFAGTVGATNIAPHRITMEILETGELLTLPATRQRLADLKATGSRIALDDVGTAYASLLRLKQLPIDEIKLDQGFIRDLGNSPENLALVQGIRSMAQGLRVKLVVKGVETRSILDAMRALMMDLVQGYAIARPMPADEMARWLNAWDPEAALPPEPPGTLLGEPPRV